MLRTATFEEIKAGKVTDVYFERTKKILDARQQHEKVVAEFAAKSLPRDSEWAVFSGLADVLGLLKDIPVDVEAIPEGTLFTKDTPVLSISGDYLTFGIYETSILGLICQASGIATQAARCALAARGRPLLAFGTRRMHPALAPILDRNAYIGGCTGISTVLSAEILGIPASGTIPHALILIVGDTLKATQDFDQLIDPDVPRIALIDTFHDEKFEALRVAEALKDKLYGLRFDTPASRRGNFVDLIREARWELDIRGYNYIKILVSGGLDETEITKLNPVADAYGVGTSISNAPVIDFSMDIVDIDGRPVAKRGKTSGKKDVYLGGHPLDLVTHFSYGEKPKNYRKLTQKYIQRGAIKPTLPDDGKIKKYVESQIKQLEICNPPN